MASRSIESMYDSRAPTYDNAKFHARLAEDHVRAAGLVPGLSVLDLACGTGLVTLPAARAVGASGRVVGVDISAEMLRFARQKAHHLAESERLPAVEWVRADVLDSDALRLRLLGREEEEGFDVVFCAAALVLMEDPVRALRGWTSLLKRGGKLVTDIPDEEGSSVALHLLTRVAKGLGVDLGWDQSWAGEDGALERVMREAGLDVDKVEMTELYERYDRAVEEGAEVFRKLVDEGMGRALKDDVEGKRERAREEFVREWRKRADMGEGQGKGVVRGEVRFWIGVGRKPEGEREGRFGKKGVPTLA